MRNLIVFLVILQLTATVIEINGVKLPLPFKFGDIIAFPREIICPCSRFAYSHYAVYVGDKTFVGKTSEHNIIHFTGPVKDNFRFFNCIFDKLNIEEKHVKDNYLDEHPKFTVGSEDEIAARIKEVHKECGHYGPLANNCEHLATYVRYGVPLSLQRGTVFENLCKNDSGHNIKEILEIIGPDPKKVCDSSCPLKRKGPG